MDIKPPPPLFLNSWAGRPAKKLRDLSEQEIAEYPSYAPHYVELSRDYRDELGADAPTAAW